MTVETAPGVLTDTARLPAAGHQADAVLPQAGPNAGTLGPRAGRRRRADDDVPDSADQTRDDALRQPDDGDRPTGASSSRRSLTTAGAALGHADRAARRARRTRPRRTSARSWSTTAPRSRASRAPATASRRSPPPTAGARRARPTTGATRTSASGSTPPRPRWRVTKGVLDAGHRTSRYTTTPIVADQRYPFSFPLLPYDYTFQPGHQIGVVIVGSFRDYGTTRLDHRGEHHVLAQELPDHAADRRRRRGRAGRGRHRRRADDGGGHRRRRDGRRRSGDVHRGRHRRRRRADRRAAAGRPDGRGAAQGRLRRVHQARHGRRLGAVLRRGHRRWARRSRWSTAWPSSRRARWAAGRTRSPPRYLGEGAYSASASSEVSHLVGVQSGPGGTVPATLALTLGAAAAFGPFTPGLDHTYTATTNANVISTAGDAALTVDGGKLDQRRVHAARAAADRVLEVLVERPGLQRSGHGHVHPAHRRHRAAAHGRVRQDADVHVVDDDAVTRAWGRRR